MLHEPKFYMCIAKMCEVLVNLPIASPCVYACNNVHPDKLILIKFVIPLKHINQKD